MNRLLVAYDSLGDWFGWSAWRPCVVEIRDTKQESKTRKIPDMLKTCRRKLLRVHRQTFVKLATETIYVVRAVLLEHANPIQFNTCPSLRFVF